MANWNTIPGNTQANPGQTVRRKLDDSGWEGVKVPTNKDDVGLGNVNNTSDLDKPVSNATQTAIDNIPTLTPQTEIESLNVDVATMADLGNKINEMITTLQNAGVTE